MARMSLPPGPKIPGAAQMLAWFVRPIPLMERSAARYGDAFTLRLAGWGTFVFTSDPKDIKAVFTGDPKILHAGEGNRSLGAILGEQSVLLLDEKPHMRQRKLLLPPFHGERMHFFADVMRDSTDDVIDHWPVGRVFAAHAPLQQITLSVILRCVFGLRPSPASQQLATLLEEAIGASVNPVVFYPLLQRDLGSLTPYHRFIELRNRVDEALYAIIAQRRADPDAPNKADVLSLLLSARDEEGEPMSDVELRDELITVLVAGHETTATSLAWTLQLLLTHPAVLDRVIGELEAEVGGAQLNPELLPRLHYLDAVIKESLRLRPIIPIVARRLKAPFEISGYQIPRSIYVAPCIWLTHRRPDLYPAPQTFRPERFVDHKPDPYEWLPFGGGIRRCIGQAFALYEMKVVLATIFLRARLHVPSDYRAQPVRRSITYAPSEGVPVILDSCGPRRRSPGRFTHNVAHAPTDTTVRAQV